MKSLAILSAGAAKGVVTALQDRFRAQTGAEIQAVFGAVGAIKEKLEGGAPCDVIILTDALIDELSRLGQVASETRAALGRVRTGIAVRENEEALPNIGNHAALCAALRSSAGIYVPDTTRSTAGIHFMNVLRKLGIEQEVAARIREFPNGATAMRELANAVGGGLIGCTQITEIKYTPGVSLVGPLPTEFELSTIYAAAVCTHGGHKELAQQFVELITGNASRRVREQGGFEP